MKVLNLKFIIKNLYTFLCFPFFFFEQNEKRERDGDAEGPERRKRTKMNK